MTLGENDDPPAAICSCAVKNYARESIKNPTEYFVAYKAARRVCRHTGDDTNEGTDGPELGSQVGRRLVSQLVPADSGSHLRVELHRPHHDRGGRAGGKAGDEPERPAARPSWRAGVLDILFLARAADRAPCGAFQPRCRSEERRVG